jgi:hypothetical protein
VGDADTLHLALVIEVIEHPVGHDGDIAFFPLAPFLYERKGEEKKEGSAPLLDAPFERRKSPWVPLYKRGSD